ncbi:Glucosyltransferase-like protein [Xylographa parallela]|nr:Glucosyltransferase-like protein [Xylographa parallela]
MFTPHRPRKKKKAAVTTTSVIAQSLVVTDPKTTELAPAFPLVSFLWPGRKSTSQWIVLPLILMVAGLFRWTVGIWGYSGYQTPPMHGDFEAQRHWMEITTQLPISKWYFYDLQYWGLDYPPLTAYHSWLLGKVGSLIQPRWFTLGTSRGTEEQLLKVYMRATVLVSEYASYVPAAILFNRKIAKLRGISAWESSVVLAAVLLQPSTILIDHAHFQYNTVILGLVLASMTSVLANRYLWSCVFFVGALCFKQMALYFAPAMFAYLVGICLVPRPNVLRFVSISLVTILSFAVIYGPLLLGSLYESTKDSKLVNNLEPPPTLKSLPLQIDTNSWYYPLVLQLAQSMYRIFPFARGIFEDKVANFWGCVHTVHKLNGYPIPMLQRISMLATFISILPTCMTISLFPRKELLPWAMASSAWGFFLFSFQVHEKSVLLPLLPMTVLLGIEGGLGTELRAWIGWANIIGVWTLFPLLKRDELRMPYAVLTLLWTYLLGLPPVSWRLYTPRQSELAAPTKLLHLAFYMAMLIWHVLEAFVAPPAGKPDLWVVINTLIGAAGFGICLLWCSWQLILRSGLMEDYFGVRIRLEKLEKVDVKEKKALKKSQ